MANLYFDKTYLDILLAQVYRTELQTSSQQELATFRFFFANRNIAYSALHYLAYLTYYQEIEIIIYQLSSDACGIEFFIRRSDLRFEVKTKLDPVQLSRIADMEELKYNQEVQFWFVYINGNEQISVKLEPLQNGLKFPNYLSAKLNRIDTL